MLAQAAGHKRASKLAGAGGVGKFIIVQAHTHTRTVAHTVARTHAQHAPLHARTVAHTVACTQRRTPACIIVQARMRWSMAESAHVRSGHYWLARTVETALGSGTCIEKIEDRRTTRSLTVFTKGDYAISVEWFDRVDVDAMGLSFSKWIPDEEDDESEMPSVINSTELRAVEGHAIDLDSTDSLVLSVVSTKQVEPALVPPPSPQKVSGRTRTAAGARVSKGGEGVGVQARAAAPSLPLDAVVEVRADLDAAARGQCW